MELNTYLNFNGNCEEAIHFYAKAFGVTIDFIQRYGDMPSENSNEAFKDKILHASMTIAGRPLMASDIMGDRQVTFGDSVTLSVNCTSAAELDDTFKTLSEGGQITMPVADTFWGARFGMFTDKFGIHWMLNYDYPKTQD